MLRIYQRNLNQNLLLSHKKGKWRMLLPKDQVLSIDEKSPESRRIFHCAKWCEQNKAPWKFQQFIFSESLKSEPLARDVLIHVEGDSTINLEISKARKISKTRPPGELFSSFLDTVNDAVLITEADHIDEPGPRILFANKAFAASSA
jgi:hypothetical protein